VKFSLTGDGKLGIEISSEAGMETGWKLTSVPVSSLLGDPLSPSLSHPVGGGGFSPYARWGPLPPLFGGAWWLIWSSHAICELHKAKAWNKLKRSWNTYSLQGYLRVLSLDWYVLLSINNKFKHLKLECLYNNIIINIYTDTRKIKKSFFLWSQGVQ